MNYRIEFGETSFGPFEIKLIMSPFPGNRILQIMDNSDAYIDAILA